MPVTQIDPPPRRYASVFGQVFEPNSSGPATVLKRQIFLPVAASKASMKPRMPYSAPAMPRITLSFTTSGATVAE